MKMLIAAVALATAVPAAAQNAADHHAGHHATAAPAHHADHQGHAQHAGKKGCCVKGADGKMACKHDKAGGKKPDCCKEHAAGHAPKAGHGGH